MKNVLFYIFKYVTIWTIVAMIFLIFGRLVAYAFDGESQERELMVRNHIQYVNEYNLENYRGM